VILVDFDDFEKVTIMGSNFYQVYFNQFGAFFWLGTCSKSSYQECLFCSVKTVKLRNIGQRSKNMVAQQLIDTEKMRTSKFCLIYK
jgi:hypothetical protein